MSVGHFGRAVYGHLFKFQTARPVDQIVVRFGDDFIGGGVAVAAGGVEGHIRLHPGVKEPEGHIHALDLLDVAVLHKGPGQDGPVAVVLFEGRHGVLPGFRKGNDVVRLPGAAEVPRNHRGIAAVGAGGGRGGLLTDQLRAAVGAGIGPQLLFVGAPVAARLGQHPVFLLLRSFFKGLGRLLGIGLLQGLDLFRGIGASAEFAFQLAGILGVVQGARAGRAFVLYSFVGHRGPSLSLSCAAPGGAAKTVSLQCLRR